MRTPLIILSLAMFLIPVTASGQIKYDTKPFDLSLDKLPAKYPGCDIVAFHQRYLTRATLLKKSEFETSEQYRDKLNKYREPIFAFVYSPEEGYTKYDADNQKFTIDIYSDFSLSDSWQSGSLYEGHQRYTLKKFSKPGGSYVGLTRLGLKQNVQVRLITEYSFIFPGTAIEGITREQYSSFIKLEVDCNLEKAKITKPNLKILFLCRPIFSGVEKDSSTPTIDRPWENRFTINYLRAELSEIWVFNFSSGEVLMKIKVQG